jgi:hypothetical protein
VKFFCESPFLSTCAHHMAGQTYREGYTGCKIIELFENRNECFEIC